MTWRSAVRYHKTGGGRGYAAPTREPTGRGTAPSRPAPPTPSRPVPPQTIPGERLPTPARPSYPPNIPAMPRPTLKFIPKGDPTPFHPPGPGIGLRKGPAPALGRPGLLPGDHGGWKNESCYSRGSKGWKPDILSLGDAHNCPGQKGPQSPYRPPNISGNSASYNTRLFRNENDVGEALLFLGYNSPDGNAMLRRFQGDWNRVVARLASSPRRYENIVFAYLPQGDLQTDGAIGPNSLNALEIAIANQQQAKLPWVEVVKMVTIPGNGYGRQKRYNAAQGM